MHILVIDRDALTNQLLLARLEALGHRITVEQNKNTAFDRLHHENFDCIMLDPAPLGDARPVVIGLWKSLRGAFKPYIFLLSKSASREDAVLAGTNDVLAKPFDPRDLEAKIANAERLISLHRFLGVPDDIHSAGGMVGKAAFNQLFLSAIDRAFRYGERSLVILAQVTNAGTLLTHTPTTAHKTLTQLGEQLSLTRRQSDVIGRIGADRFGILLQRPLYDSEPLDALNRFTETLEKFCQGFADPHTTPHIDIQLIELPEGALQGQRHAPHRDLLHQAAADATTASGTTPHA